MYGCWGWGRYWSPVTGVERVLGLDLLLGTLFFSGILGGGVAMGAFLSIISSYSTPGFCTEDCLTLPKSLGL
jgi:hypothetical protein